MNYYLGNVGSESALGPSNTRYFYALRVDDEGTLYFTRVDQWTGSDTIEINKPGASEDDWQFFEIGIDFFDGKTEDHERPYKNLYFDQYKFDSKSIYYYLNENGELIVRLNQSYNYPQDV